MSNFSQLLTVSGLLAGIIIIVVVLRETVLAEVLRKGIVAFESRRKAYIRFGIFDSFANKLVLAVFGYLAASILSLIGLVLPGGTVRIVLWWLVYSTLLIGTIQLLISFTSYIYFRTKKQKKEKLT